MRGAIPALAGVLLAGCATAPTADPGPPTRHVGLVQPADDAWPARDADPTGRNDVHLGATRPALVQRASVRVTDYDRRWTLNGRIREISRRTVRSSSSSGR